MTAAATSLEAPGPAAVRQVDAEAASKAAEAAKRRFIDGLYRAHFAELVAWLRQRYGPGPPAPEDVAQTAFERIAALERVDHIRHPKSFLYRAAANAALDAIGWIKRTRRFVDDELYRKGAELEEITPERVSMANEQFEVLADALHGLPPKQKEVLIRVRFLGQTLEEVAAETGWSKSDIFRQLKAALVVVQTALSAFDPAGVRDGTSDD